jgi:acyl-CoA reductase-like NAD-dependent aldehyde dehydrogenase
LARKRPEVLGGARALPIAKEAAIDVRIEQALVAERRLIAEALGEELGKLLAEEREDTMKAMREEIRFLFTYAPLIGPHVWLQGRT